MKNPTSVRVIRSNWTEITAPLATIVQSEFGSLIVKSIVTGNPIDSFAPHQWREWTIFDQSGNVVSHCVKGA